MATPASGRNSTWPWGLPRISGMESVSQVTHSLPGGHRTHNKGGPLGSEWSHLFGLFLLKKKKITNFVADTRDSSCLHLVSIMSSFGWEVGVQAEFKGSCCLCCPRQKGLDRVKDLLGLACRTQARLQTPQCHTMDAHHQQSPHSSLAGRTSADTTSHTGAQLFHLAAALSFPMFLVSLSPAG